MKDKKYLVQKLIFLFLILFQVFSVWAQKNDSAKVKGRVTDYFGSPLNDKEVEFFLLERKIGGYVSAEGRFIKSTRTDKEGNYEISNLPAGNYRVVAGNAKVWEFYLATDAAEILDLGNHVGYIHDFPMLKVSGKVKDTNKNPVKDATVTLTNPFDETEISRTRTNNNGEYKIQFIQPGQYILYVSKPGFSVSTSSFLINAFKGTIFPETDSHMKFEFIISPLKAVK